ncbi:MAG: T9SS type A sorting domain-containing protein [Crocinitomicaceae bacterium]|nr:T9SS type A sorting domain-containing protein [Crocinitomicaceae bacterium]
MKRQIIAIVLGTTSLLFANSALAYHSVNDNPGATQSQQSSQQMKGANCVPATASLVMNFNDVSALIEQGGSMWTNRATLVSAYEVPAGSGLKVIYAGALWMGGTNADGQLKLAALTFRSANDFWPGPLTVTPGTGDYDPSQPSLAGATRDFGQADINPEDCLAYDKFYTITKAEVIGFNAWFDCQVGTTPVNECVEVVAPTNETMIRLNNWPAHGDLTKGQDYYLAPFYDNPTNGLDGEYNVDDGDHPWFDDILNRDDVECGIDRRVTLFGDETNWWVFNDKGNIHGETGGDPIGMEIRAQAFAFATNDEVNRMTFYNYELINRGTQTLQNTYFSQYIDADVGNATDDYAGCDVSRGLGYTYNGDNNDESGNGVIGYGENPPAVGCDFFEGPYQDADGIDNVGPYFDSINQVMVVPTVAEAITGNGIVYSGIGIGYSDSIIDNERYGMRRFTYYTNGAGIHGDPSTAAQFYNYMEGSWADGSEMYYGGQGFTGTVPSDYLFPGDSDPLGWATQGAIVNGDWSEVTESNVEGDRRFVQSAGPFILEPGAVNNITVGIVYGRGSDGTAFGSVEALKKADTKAQALFDACFRILEPPYAPRLDIQELENSLVLTISNPSSSNNKNESYREEDKINIVDPNVDRYYTFEGYQIYQMQDADAGVSEIGDPLSTKARLVAQCDIENDIVDLVNFDFDEDLGFSVPVQKVEAANSGIQHSFLMTEDAFAQGDKALVNHKTYYYIAVAYAHNEFKKYDPSDPNLLDGQQMPYISSRLGADGGSIKSVSAIPHNPSPEAGGTIQMVEYGSGPQIKRLDGFGNGANSLELNNSSKETIIANGYMENPVYANGSGPINVKVVDPLNVAEGYFECIFRDNIATITNSCDTADWIIMRYESEGGNLIDSVASSLPISSDNEQLIPQWGISVQINQSNYYFADGASGQTFERRTDILGASVTFSDSTKRWLSGVQDDSRFYPTNWVLSGIYDPTGGTATPDDDECTDNTLPEYLDYTDPCNYPDLLGQDADKEWSSILGGTIAPHKLVANQASYAPIAYNGYDAASARGISSISYLPSVDIVLTRDKSKWTRCPVIELGRAPALNVGGAEAGALRESPSVDKNGNPDGSGTTGLGWFPGYAIDVESGARLYMMFGENSFLVSDNGADMIWNPTDRLADDNGSPILGGQHAFYVFSYQNQSKNAQLQSYDYPAYDPAVAEGTVGNAAYDDLLDIAGGNLALRKRFYGSISWVANPLLAPAQDLLSSDATIKLRVNKEYKHFSNETDVTGGPNNGLPMYSWSTDDIATQYNDNAEATSALDLINVVPNPYYAYSEYERNRLDTRVKITNLPEVCTVKIYSTNGKLVRTFEKDNEVTSVDWDLNNFKNIPVAGGVYLIHVDVPGVGEKVLKFFGGMRQIDLQGI